MSGLDAAKTSLERLLGDATSETTGECRFALRGGTLLLRALPGDATTLAACISIAPASGTEREREETSRAFLRLRLAGLRRRPRLEAALDAETGWMLFFRFSPDAGGEWLDGVRELLNEAQTLRDLLSPEGGGLNAGHGAFSLEGLFRMRP